jgi:hypothetical protein
VPGISGRPDVSFDGKISASSIIATFVGIIFGAHSENAQGLKVFEDLFTLTVSCGCCGGAGGATGMGDGSQLVA